MSLVPRSTRTASFNKVASWRLIAALITLALVAAACGSDSTTDAASAPEAAVASETTESEEDEAMEDEEEAMEDEEESTTEVRTLNIGAIPDQEPERLQRTYDLLATYLEAEIDNLEVEYVPVTEYNAAVTGFSTGDLDAVWFGGLTGVQARLEVEGSTAILQRDIDEDFTSVFIARADSGIEPFTSVADLQTIAGRSFTFGSESSTSGRLMPQAFLNEAGIDPSADFASQPGFSGSHDATIEVVTAGSFEVGALNSQVWDARVEEGAIDTDEVIEIFRTPEFFDYHWVAQPDLDVRLGEGFTDELTEAFVGLDASDPDHAAILELFGAGSFIVTENDNYEAIELVGRDSGLIR